MLKSFGRARPEEYWHVLTHMVRAAGEVGQLTIAHRLLHRASTTFPGSVRHDVLHGMLHEAAGRPSLAIDAYIRAVSADALHGGAAYKRQVAALKMQGKVSEAATLLNYYLHLFGRDAEAWVELVGLSLRLGRVAHALFASAELVLMDPGNYAYHILAADVYMTCSPSMHNVGMAQTHYISALNCSRRNNLRALYGIWLSTKLLLQQEGPRGGHDDDDEDSASKDEAQREREQNERLQAQTRHAVMAIYTSNHCRKQDIRHIERLFGDSK